LNQWSLVLGLCNLNWTEGKGQMFATLLEWLCYLIAPSELILRTSIRNINSSGNNSEIQFVFINSSSNCISILPKLKCLVRNPHLKRRFSLISSSNRKLSPNLLVILLLWLIYSALKQNIIPQKGSKSLIFYPNKNHLSKNSQGDASSVYSVYDSLFSLFLISLF